MLVGNLVRCIKEILMNAYRRPQVAFLGATDPSTGRRKETNGKQVILTPAAHPVYLFLLVTSRCLLTVRLFHLVLGSHDGRALVPIPKRSASP